MATCIHRIDSNPIDICAERITVAHIYLACREILQYLMTLPAHRRVSKEGQSVSGSLASPGKASLGASGFISMPSRQSSSTIAAQARRASSQAATVGPRSEPETRSVRFEDVEAPEAPARTQSGQVPLGVMPAAPPKAATSQREQEPSALIRAGSAQRPLSEPVPSPFQSPGIRSNRQEAGTDPVLGNDVSAPDGSAVQAVRESSPQPIAGNLRSGLPPKGAQHDESGSAIVERPKPPPNPFAQMSMQFSKDAGNTDAPFGASRLS